jgi:hypothetical protein
MLKQSLEAGEGAPPMVENGRLTQLGSYRQLVHLHETSRLVGFEIGMAADERQGATRTALEFAYSVRRKAVFLRHFETGVVGTPPLIEVTADNAGKVERVVLSEPWGDATGPRILGAIARSGCRFRAVPAWERWGAEAGRPITEFVASPAFYAECDGSVGAFEKTVSALSYLGPDRDDAPVVGHISGDTLPDVGARGENAAALLHSRLYAAGTPADLYGIAEWLARLGIGKHLRVVPIEEHLYEVTIEDLQTGLAMNLHEAGSAARRIFPLVIQAAYSPLGSTMLLDQPEAQLHPRLQSAVADLLTEVVQGGKRLLIETASEPFVRRWLHQVRTGKLPAADLGIFFAHKLDGVSRFTEVEVESDGTLPNGPPGFWSDE